MAFRKRLRSFNLPRTRAGGSRAPNNLDVWLQRISHISQLGLFVFTVWAIFFTVIPLYQKALLDEQIAQKEIKLRRMQTALDSAYKKIRRSVVADFIFQAGAQCSGLLLPVKSLKGLEENSQRMGPSHAEQILAIEPAKCLAHELSLAKAQDLRQEDAVFLRKEVNRISERLEIDRRIGLKRHSNAEETIKKATYPLPTDGFGGAVAHYLLEGKSQEFQESVLKRIALDREQSSAANEYANQVRSRLTELRNAKWPDGDGGDF